LPSRRNTRNQTTASGTLRSNETWNEQTLKTLTKRSGNWPNYERCRELENTGRKLLLAAKTRHMLYNKDDAPAPVALFRLFVVHGLHPQWIDT
jgi:hypothetical protein